MKKVTKNIVEDTSNDSSHVIQNSYLFNKILAYPAKKKDILKDQEIDYKNIELLSTFLSESTKIIGSKVTGVSRKDQSKLTKAIKISQNLALIPFN